MRVFIVEEIEEHEGSRIIDVYATYDLASLAIVDLPIHTKLSYEISEFEVEGS